MNTIRLRGPADVLAVLPFQLGYHPSDAVVVVAVTGRSIGLVQRLDTPPSEEVEAAVDALVPALVREEPDAVLLVGYESQRSSARPVLDGLREACADLSIDVMDRLLVRDGRWFALDCATGCCPPEGAPLPTPEDTPAVADFVAMETAPLPDRGAVTRQLEPDPARSAEVAGAVRRLRELRPGRRAHAGAAFGLPSAAAVVTPPDGPLLRVVGEEGAGPAHPRGVQRAAQRAADHDRDVRRLEQLSAWAVVCDVSAGRPPLDGLSPEEVAALALSLRDVHLRDAMIAWSCPGSLPLDALDGDLPDQVRSCLPPVTWGGGHRTRSRAVAARRLQARLVELCRMLPREESAPALTVLAHLAWSVLGDGALASAAVDRALAAEPDYVLAQLVQKMVAFAFRPPVIA